LSEDESFCDVDFDVVNGNFEGCIGDPKSVAKVLFSFISSFLFFFGGGDGNRLVLVIDFCFDMAELELEFFASVPS